MFWKKRSPDKSYNIPDTSRNLEPTLAIEYKIVRHVEAYSNKQ